MNSTRRIGILDSGVGGLTVLREIHHRFPGLDLHYVGDSARCPYGIRPAEEIRERVRTITEYLLSHEVELVVIACNSATIHAVEWLRERYPINFVGMEPGVKPAALLTKSGVIGVLATEASIAGEKFLRLLHDTTEGTTVITQPCPRFVELVEQGILEGPEVDRAILEYTGPALEKGADVIVLGCTHYPFLRASMEKLLPDHIAIVDTGEAVARRVGDLLHCGQSLEREGVGSIFIDTTGAIQSLQKLLPKLLPNDDTRIEVNQVEFVG